MTTCTLSVGDQTYSVTLADTEAARALAARLPLTLSMTELNGNEKYANLGSAPPHCGHPAGGDPHRRPDALWCRLPGPVLWGFHHSLLIYPPGQAGRPHRLGGSPGYRRGDGHLDCKLTGKTPPDILRDAWGACVTLRQSAGPCHLLRTGWKAGRSPAAGRCPPGR